jgi:hypothetical protein
MKVNSGHKPTGLCPLLFCCLAKASISLARSLKIHEFLVELMNRKSHHVIETAVD